MSKALRTVGQALARSRDFAAGLLIGTSVVTPVFAATEITGDEWTTMLLMGSIALLGLGLLLKVRRPHIKAAPAPGVSAQQALRDSIEQYRPQAYH